MLAYCQLTSVQILQNGIITTRMTREGFIFRRMIASVISLLSTIMSRTNASWWNYYGMNNNNNERILSFFAGMTREFISRGVLV